MNRFDLIFQVADVLWNLYVRWASWFLLLVAIIIVRVITLDSEQGKQSLSGYFREIVEELKEIDG